MLKQIIFYCIIFLCISCGGNEKNLNIHHKYEHELERLLSKELFYGKSGGKYQVEQIVNPKDSVYVNLIQKGVINKNSYFFYSNENCISLITRISDKPLDKFKDIVITMNYNEGEFLCGINNIYSLNTNENIISLNIKVYNLTSFMTLAIVEN
jgi:hypothetical protein